MSIGIEVTGHVAVIELQAPPHNFLTPTLVHGVADALDSLDADPDVRAAVLCAQGRSFCAGADFGGDDGPLGGSSSGEPIGGPTTLELYEGAARLCAAPLPVVAAVQGPAIGGGLGLAMSAMIRVASPEARFSANFAALGIHPGFGLSVLLPEQLGPSRAAEVLLSSRRYTGEEAVQIGLADRCVPAEELRATAIEMASQIAVNAPLAVRAITATLRAGLADRVRAATAHEAAEQRRLSATADAAEGIAAVTERRAGNFTGR
ncbi:MAG: enoyl-CoA hydratase/isomerase family protein [Acidimicrobiales bacterium]